jgi:large subunit ribosomal protein L33
MAKKGKGHRQMMLFACTKCGNKNYITEKNKINTTDRIEMNKFCKFCKEHTPHKENSRLK